MKQFIPVTKADVVGALASQEEPRDVNPLDPDDEVWYFNYDNWRDFEDAAAAENDIFEEDELDYQNHLVDQLSEW
jgi:hypothetical protein